MAVIKSGDSTDQAHVTPAKALSVDGSGVTQPVSISGAVPVNISSPVDSNGNVNINIADVSGNAAVAKGTQGAGAVTTQDFKDSGRTYVILYVDRIAGLTAEALMTMNINKGGTVTTGTSYTVTAGKIFRIQSVNAEILNTTTVINRVQVRVRSAASVLVTSPIIAMAAASSQAALATAGDTDPHTYPDGLEIAGGQQVGMSQICNVTTAGIVSAIIVGYEY